MFGLRHFPDDFFHHRGFFILVNFINFNLEGANHRDMAFSHFLHDCILATNNFIICRVPNSVGPSWDFWVKNTVWVLVSGNKLNFLLFVFTVFQKRLLNLCCELISFDHWSNQTSLFNFCTRYWRLQCIYLFLELWWNVGIHISH